MHIHLQPTSSIAITPICSIRKESTEWTREIENYLQTGHLPENSKHAHKVRMQVARFTLIGDCLYKRSFGGPYLKCLDSTEAQYVLAKLHEGICSNHTGGRSLAHSAHSQGYYWPTMKQDSKAYVKKCDRCQRHALIPRMPAEVLNPITNPWPFAQWEMDIVGPLPVATAQKKFLIVSTNYFSKWVEAEAYANIKDKDISKFVWKNIICRNSPSDYS